MNKVELAHELFVDKCGLEVLRNNKKLNASKIVRGLVTLIFTREEVLNQCVTGTKCNFNRKANREEPSVGLDNKKIRILKDELRNILEKNRKHTAQEVNEEVINVEKYIKHKLSTEKQALKRATKKTNKNMNDVPSVITSISTEIVETLPSNSNEEFERRVSNNSVENPVIAEVDLENNFSLRVSESAGETRKRKNNEPQLYLMHFKKKRLIADLGI